MTSGVFVSNRTGSDAHNFNAIVPGTVQVVAYTGTAGQSAALGTSTKLVRVIASSACHIKFGANPTATTSDIYLPANVAEYFGVTPGDKISAVQVASGGNLNITEAA